MARLMCRGSIRLVWATALLLAPHSLGSTGSQHPTGLHVGGGIWKGGAGLWSFPGNWDTSQDWQLHSSNGAVIDAGNPMASMVFLDVDIAIPALTIDAGDTLRVLPGHWLTLQSASMAPAISCAGVIRLDGATGHSRIVVAGGETLVLNGGGLVTLASASHSSVSGENGQSLLHNINVLIHGAGRIGENSLGIVNSGIIRANLLEQPLVIDPSSSGLTNAGELQAVSGGRLVLNDGVYLNSGRLLVGGGSRIELEGATIIGGSIEAEGDGFIRSMIAPATLQNIISHAPIELGPTRMTLIGHLENNREFTVVPGQTLSPTFDEGPDNLPTAELVIPPGTGDFTLDGDGSLRLYRCTVHSGSTTAAGRLVHGPNHTITGEGLLGANTVGLVNHGTIIGDGYGSIAIDPPNALVFENTGTLVAAGFGGVSVSGATFVNNGVVEVRDASRFIITSSVTLVNNAAGTLNGGIWRVLADGHPTTLGIWGGAQIFSNNADILLSGVGSFFAPINVLSENLGRLSLRNGRDFTTSSGFLTNSGVLDVGARCLFKVSGLYLQDANGRLIVEVDGSSGEGLTATGQAALAGVLEIRLAPGSHDVEGQTVEILRAAGISGSFSQIIAPSGVEVQIGPTSVSVVIHQLCPGDLTGDGTVAIDDLLAVIAAWGQCPPAPQACPWDLNANQVVDVGDLLVVIAGWGACPN